MNYINGEISPELEFAILNPSFRGLSTNQLTEKIRNLKESAEASNYVYSIESAIVDHGGIDDVIDIRRDIYRQNITEIIISHEGSRTGAPVVCKNLAASLSQVGEPLLVSFGENSLFKDMGRMLVINFSKCESRNSYWGFLLGRWLLGLGCISSSTKVIGSTLEVSDFIIGLSDAINKGACTLLHEHPYYYGHDRLERLLAASQSIIYSSDYVLNGWMAALKSDADKYFNHWMWTKQPQPIQSDYHLGKYSKAREYSPSIPASQGKIIISGAGHIQPRKGVHLFLEIVAEIARTVYKHPSFLGYKIIATWIGKPEQPTEYSLYIDSKANWLQRGLENLEINLLPSCDDFISYIQKSDFFLSTSTVDPLPNVVLDALANGVPAFVLGGSNGHEEYFVKNGLNELVLPPNSIESSASACMHFLASGNDNHCLLRSRMESLIKSFPSHDAYAALVREEAFKANLIYQQISHSALRLSRKGWQDVLCRYGSNFLSYQLPNRQAEYGSIIAAMHSRWGYRSKVQSPISAKYDYIRLIQKLVAKDSRTRTNQSHCSIASIINIDSSSQESTIGYDLHIHSYYPDVTLKILRRIESLGRRPNNIFVTYPSKSEREVQALAGHTSLHITCIMTPDIGRNILPIKYIIKHIASEYLIHLHTKKSTHSDPVAINRWNEYLISSLIGNERSPSRVAKLLHAVHVQSCAVAYPLEPTYQQLGRNAIGVNKVIASLCGNSLASVSTRTLCEKDYFPYPCGCMFIADKTFCQNTLGPMIELINIEEVAEPLDYDGTPLHAIERCIPLAASLTNRDIGLVLPPEGITR